MSKAEGERQSNSDNLTYPGLFAGDPKAIPWTHVTPLKAAADAWTHQVRPSNGLKIVQADYNSNGA